MEKILNPEDGQPDKLTEMQKNFCHEYLADFHQTNAAIRAGCSPKSAHTTASRWLKMDKIKEYIAELQAEESKLGSLSIDRLKRELSRMIYIDPAEAYNSNGELKAIADMPAHLRAAIASVETIELPGGVGNIKKVNFWPKHKMVELAMKHLGLFELDNEQKRTIQTIIIDGTDEDDESSDSPIENGSEDVDADDESEYDD